jgi:hypothetical protein
MLSLSLLSAFTMWPTDLDTETTTNYNNIYYKLTACYVCPSKMEDMLKELIDNLGKRPQNMTAIDSKAARRFVWMI